VDPFRVRVEATNDALRKSFEQTPLAGVTLARVGDALLSPSGELSGDLASDFLHPTPAGYARLLNALVPIVERCRTAPARQP
jgi:lysophospholipase L1-like esterase